MQKGATAQPIPIGQPQALVAADLERLKQPRYVASSPQKLRDSHHMIARLAAAGLRGFQIAERTGYSTVRVNDLLNSPAMDELVAQYRLKVDESFVENQDTFFELATRNMLAAERHISDQIAEIEDAGELLPIGTALRISRDAADRFGYGKHQTQTNVNVDFAASLEKAIARSGKGPVLNGSAAPSPSVAQPAPVAQPLAVTNRTSSSPVRTQRATAVPQPLIRRRA